MRPLPLPEPEHPKLRLHDAVQAALQDERLAPGIGGHAALTRWALIGELALPDARRGLVTVTSDAAGSDLQTWDARGLYITALLRAMRSGS